MAGRRAVTPGVARLAADLLGAATALGATASEPLPDPMADELAEWLASLPRFRAFADAHRDKIRKKLRLARGPEARLDVRAELLVARRLLADRHVELAFEPAGATRGGPDFGVTYRGGRAFNLEVTRPRRLAAAEGAARPVLAKLRQLPAGAPNVLLLATPTPPPAALDVAAAMRALRARADAKEEAFFTRRRFLGSRDFYDRFLRLGAVITWSEGADAPTDGVGDRAGHAEAWANGSARIPVPDRALRACLEALGSPP